MKVRRVRDKAIFAKIFTVSAKKMSLEASTGRLRNPATGTKILPQQLKSEHKKHLTTESGAALERILGFGNSD